MKKVIIVGGDVANPYLLETSYKRAFEKSGFNVWGFDSVGAINRYIKLGKVGRYINQFIGVEPWLKKMSREFAIQAKAYKPDLIIIGANAKLSFGALAYLKNALSAKIILLWPDPLTNMDAHILNTSVIYDGVASYSKNEIVIFEKLGFKNVSWVPFAADEVIHQIDDLPNSYANDLCFIGGYRPERADTIAHIIQHFPTLAVSVYGTNWRRTEKTHLKKNIIDKPLRGTDFAKKINQTFINLNVMDDGNYPAANMRFFETFVANGLQLSSACPEFEMEFVDKQHLLYYHNNDELIEKIDFALTHKNTLNKIRQDANKLVLEKHTYLHRVKTIIEQYI